MQVESAVAGSVVVVVASAEPNICSCPLVPLVIDNSGWIGTICFPRFVLVYNNYIIILLFSMTQQFERILVAPTVKSTVRGNIYGCPGWSGLVGNLNLYL